MASHNRGKGKLKLRDLSRLPPTAEELDAVRKRLGEETSPIVAAILDGVIVEHELDAMLRPLLKRNDEDTWKELTGESGPLGTMAHKIMLGRALGLYNDQLRTAFDTVRHIRNNFAHARKPLDFNHEVIVEALANIPLPAQKHGWLYKDIRRIRRGAARQPQLEFAILCMVLVLYLAKKSGRSVAARSRAKSNAYRKGLARILLSLPTTTQANPQGFLSGLQTADPSLLGRSPVLGLLFPELDKSSDKDGK